jgi:hypothetical protein
MTKELFKTFLLIRDIYMSTLSWETKYNLIFSEQGEEKFCFLCKDFRYTTYPELNKPYKEMVDEFYKPMLSYIDSLLLDKDTDTVYYI